MYVIQASTVIIHTSNTLTISDNVLYSITLSNGNGSVVYYTPSTDATLCLEYNTFSGCTCDGQKRYGGAVYVILRSVMLSVHPTTSAHS